MPPGKSGQCYSEVASGDLLTVYTNDSLQNWVPVTRPMTTLTTVVGAHINGWIFAEQTSTPPVTTDPGDESGSNENGATATTTETTATGVSTATASVLPKLSCGSISSTTSAIVFSIGVGLAVIGAVIMAAGLVIMRRLKKTLRGVAKSTVRVPSNRIAMSQESRRHQPAQQASHGGLFPTVSMRARHYTPQVNEKEAHELEGSRPSS